MKRGRHGSLVRGYPGLKSLVKKVLHICSGEIGQSGTAERRDGIAG